MEFKATTKEGKGRGAHYHIVYINEAGIGVSTTVNKHSHTFIPREEREVVTEPDMTRDIPVTVYICSPGPDGHTHELTAVPEKDDSPSDTEADVVDMVKRLFKIEQDYEKEPRAWAKECEEFIAHNQWDRRNKAKLEKEKRAALTYNELESKIDVLSGYLRQNRSDIKFFPVEGGDAKIADILTILIKCDLEKCDFSSEEVDIFEDQMIAGKGELSISIDYDEDLRGKIVIGQFPWDEVYRGPHNKKDGSDCEHLSKSKWYSLAKALQLWPEKKEALENSLNITNEDTTESPHRVEPGNQYAHSENEIKGSADFDIKSDFINIAKKELRAIETWQKEYIKVPVLVNPIDKVYHNAENWILGDAKSVETIKGFYVVYRKKTRMRISTIVGTTFIDDEYPDLPFQDFDLIPVYAKKRKDRWWGKIKSGIDPQKELNKRMSQTSDILNKAIGLGWFYDAETFFSPAEEAEFKQNAGSPAFTAKLKNLQHKPEKEESVTFPQQIVAFGEFASAKLKEILNINPDLLGNITNARSGIAIAQRKASGLMGNEFLFDNLSLAKKIMAKHYVKCVKQVYTPARILRIIAHYNKQNENNVKIGDMPFENLDEEMLTGIKNLLETDDFVDYDVAVAESAQSPTTRFTNFILWSEVAAKGLAVPPEMLIELSDLPDKDKALQYMKQMQEREAATSTLKYDVELWKTLVNAGIIPPAAAERLGISLGQ